MVKLGAWPQDIYYLSWMTQRLANRAPEWTHARKWSWSVMQQLLNPMARDIERVHKGLVEERNDMFMSAANIDLLDKLYRIELGAGMVFDMVAQDDGVEIYQVPTVYATINDVEKEITIAHKNDIESLAYAVLPSRIEFGEESFSYSEVIPRTTIGNLKEVTPNEMTVSGHLYITIRNNTIWEYRGRDRIYYPKVYIRGTTRKGTSHEEAIPLRYNGTFKTIYQWESVEEIFVSYMDNEAEITVEVLAFDRDTQLDTQNLVVPATGAESWRFLSLSSHVWGSALLSEGFVVSDLDVVRIGFEDLDQEYEIELHDSGGDTVDMTAFAIKPNSDYIFAVDNDNLYVYTTKLPYPDLTVLEQESPDTKMNVYSDRWLYARGNTIVIKTDILDISSVPWRFRWTLKEPDGSEYYLKTDGSKWPTTADVWIDNDSWERGIWREQRLELLVEETGVHTITLECLYSDERKPNNNYILTTRFLYYIPVATPETTLVLPEELRGATGLAFDADGQLWFQVSGDVYLGNVAYDYFLADYAKQAIWLREDYQKVRVKI